MATKPTPLHVVGTIIKTLFYTLVALMAALLIWRIYFSTNIPKSIERVIITDSLSEAYAEQGEYLQIFTQDQATITRTDENYGYFSVEDFIIIPEAKQIQVIFRYNNSTIEYIAEDYALDEIPSRDEELFAMSLTKTVDRTPDNKVDNTDSSALTKEVYYPSEIVSEQTLLYNYRRVVFEGVDVSDAIGIFFDIRFMSDYATLGEGEYVYDDPIAGTLCVYDREMEREPVEIPKELK